MKNWRFWALLAASLLVIVSLFNPRLPFPGKYFRYVFVFDISQSMNVDDVVLDGEKLRRLEIAKRAVWKTIEKMPCTSEAGFAIFTEHRSYLLFTPVEVCAHYKELRYMLGVIDWQIAWRSRSEIAKGLIASQRIGAALDPPARIVFLSDGHEAPPVHPDLRQVPERVDAAFRGAVIGVGGDKLSPIPRLNLAGQKIGYWKLEEINQIDIYSTGRFGTGEPMAGIDPEQFKTRADSGREHLSSLREPWLKQLAQEAGLGYLRLKTPAQTARFLTGASFAESKVTSTDIRWVFGAIALLLMVLVYLVGKRSGS